MRRVWLIAWACANQAKASVDASGRSRSSWTFEARLKPALRGCAAKKVFCEENQICGALGEAAHKVREPILAKRDVDADAIALLDELLLQVRADSIQHLKFKFVLGDVLLGGKADGGF